MEELMPIPSFGMRDIRKILTQKRRGWLSIELMIVIVAVLLFMAAAALYYPEYKNNTNRSVAAQEMETLKTAITAYAGLRADSKLPAKLEDLMKDPSIAAAEAIDGVDHGAFIPTKMKRWQAGVKDPWGTAYVYTTNADGSGTIVCTGGPTKKAMQVDF